MRKEEVQIKCNNKKKIRIIDLLEKEINMIFVFLIFISISLSIIMYCSINTYKMQKIDQKLQADVEINKIYDENDIEDIEKIRKFFLLYYEAKEYDISLDSILIPLSYKAKEAINQAQILLGKYGEILLDANKKLTFDKSNRDMKITSGAFELELYFNVDVPLDFLDYDIIPTGNGSWRENNENYIFYKFGRAIEGSLISTYMKMLDLRTITSDEKSYEANSPIYLFSERQFSNYPKYCVYVVETGEFREFPNIKEIEVTDEFVSFEDSENHLFIYCLQHDFIIHAGDTDGEGLYWTYDPEIYLPESFNNVLKEELFVEHRQCNK